MQTLRMVAVCGTALLVLAGLPLSAGPGRAASAPAQMQRMLIGAGCYRIASHATGAVGAYCLDQAGTAPRRGEILGETSSLGDATVSVGDKTMPLATALASHLLRIEGADTPDQLSLVNTTDQTLSFCVGQPVVVMGNGVAYSADLRRIYDRIVDLMRHDDRAEEPEAHDRLQQRLWSLVTTADERELATPDGKDCAVSGNAAVLCR